MWWSEESVRIVVPSGDLLGDTESQHVCQLEEDNISVVKFFMHTQVKLKTRVLNPVNLTR